MGITLVVILTQDKVKIPEMTAMCGRFASHVQIIEGSPIDIISSHLSLFIIPSLGLIMSPCKTL